MVDRRVGGNDTMEEIAVDDWQNGCEKKEKERREGKGWDITKRVELDYRDSGEAELQFQYIVSAYICSCTEVNQKNVCFPKQYSGRESSKSRKIFLATMNNQSIYWSYVDQQVLSKKSVQYRFVNFATSQTLLWQIM